MNDLDEQRIRNLRTAGWGYKAIAEFCALTRDQVRSYCTTRNLDAAPVMAWQVCHWCASPIQGAARARFCSPACRHKAWRHRQKTEPMREQTCTHCGRCFAIVDKPGQKFCCHACYVRARFGTRGGRP